MADDERRISALEARIAVLERRADDQDKGLTSVNSKLWTGVWVVLAFVANQILGLLPWGAEMNDMAFNFVSALTVAGSAFVGFSHIVPRPVLSDYFVVKKLEAERQGDTAILHVDRTIKQPLHMGFTVRIMAEGREGWVESCAMTSGTILYQPGRALPDPVTLDWWTWGRCPALPEGRALIETTWSPEGGLPPLTITTEVEG